MNSWKVQDAKARFSEFLNATLRAVAAAVLVPIEQWRRLQEASRPGLKQLLLAPAPRHDQLTPARREVRRRRPLRFR